MPVLHFNDEDFNKDVLGADSLVLVDFWAEWCGPCRAMSPTIEEVAKDLDGKPVKIGKLNVDEASETASRFQVMSIPTIVFFKNGKPIDQLIGLQDKKTLLAKIKELMK